MFRTIESETTDLQSAPFITQEPPMLELVTESNPDLLITSQCSHVSYTSILNLMATRKGLEPDLRVTGGIPPTELPSSILFDLLTDHPAISRFGRPALIRVKMVTHRDSNPVTAVKRCLNHLTNGYKYHRHIITLRQQEKYIPQIRQKSLIFKIFCRILCPLAFYRL